VTVPTLGGSVEMRVPPGRSPARSCDCEAAACPASRPGDQTVQLKIVTPPANTAEAKALYEQMRKELAFDPRANL